MRVKSVGVVGVAAVLVVVAVGAAGCARGPGATPEAAEASGPDEGIRSEGIEVHGDWVVELYDADGTLDERHEFSNALTIQGSVILVTLLRGVEVGLGHQVEANLPPMSIGLAEDPWWVFVHDAGGVQRGAIHVGTLVTVHHPASPSELWVRNASFQAATDFTLGVVRTHLVGGTSGRSGDFTATDLSSQNILVESGQLVQVEIDISFV